MGAIDLNSNWATNLKCGFSNSFAIDARSLAAFRVFLAVVQVYVLCILSPDLSHMMSDVGVHPRQDILPRLIPGLYSIYLFSGDPVFIRFLWIVHLISAAFLLIGYRSRLSAFICWILYLSLANRIYLFAQGGDKLICLLLFWSLFLPLGSRFAVDAALDTERESAQTKITSVASVALLLQAVYVYGFGAVLKTGAEWTVDASAIYAALHLDTIATPFWTLV